MSNSNGTSTNSVALADPGTELTHSVMSERESVISDLTDCLIELGRVTGLFEGLLAS